MQTLAQVCARARMGTAVAAMLLTVHHRLLTAVLRWQCLPVAKMHCHRVHRLPCIVLMCGAKPLPVYMMCFRRVVTY